MFFLKWRPKSKVEDGLENILDIKRENVFLRRALIVLGAALAGLALHILLHPNKKETVFLSSPCGNLAYADEPSSDANQTETPAQGEKSAQEQGQGLAAIKTLIMEKISPRRAKAKHTTSKTSNRLESDPSKPPAVSSGTAKDKDSELWSLLDEIRNDPTRDLIEKTFQTGGLSITFHESTSDGKFHFELNNAGPGTIYLPILETSGVRKVLIERRVLEPGSTAQGVLTLKEKRRSLDLTFRAANIAAYQFQVEVPQ